MSDPEGPRFAGELTPELLHDAWQLLREDERPEAKAWCERFQRGALAMVKDVMTDLEREQKWIDGGFAFYLVESPDEGFVGPFETRKEAQEAAALLVPDDETAVRTLTTEQAAALEADSEMVNVYLGKRYKQIYTETNNEGNWT